MAGGGRNYCHNSLDVVTSKDNYTDVGGGTVNVALKSKLKSGYTIKAESEARNSDESN